MQEDVRGYVSAASGMTEAAADRAKDLAAWLLAQGLQWSAKAPEVLEQIQQAADGLLGGQRLDPTALATAIREQVDLAIGRSSLVREEELAALRAHVTRLETRLESALSDLAAAVAAQAAPPADLPSPASQPPKDASFPPANPWTRDTSS
jgi:hypothetical protein